MRMRVGDLWFPTDAKVALPTVALTARAALATPAVPSATPTDVCAIAAQAEARNSPAAAGLRAQCNARNKTARPMSSDVLVVSKSMPVLLAPPAASPSTSTDCGPEPPRGPALASGARPYANPAAGTAWQACMDRKNAADLAALLAPIDARTAGGEGGCGPEPPFNVAVSGQKFYVNQEVGKHWLACRAAIPTPSAPSSSPSTPSASSSSPSTPSAPSASTSVQLAPDSGGGASSSASSSSSSSSSAATNAPTPTPADQSAAWNRATLAWFAFGAVAVGGVVWLAMRKRAA